MRSSRKKILAKSVISTIALVCTYTYAVPKSNPSLPESHSSNAYKMFVPHVASEGAHVLIGKSNDMLYIHEQPLLPKQKVANVAQKTCQTIKRNEIYELSAIFNDKLQLFLAYYFDDHKTLSIVDKQKDTNDLSANIDI